MPTYTDINRTSSISLPSDVSAEIIAKTIEESAIMRLARRINMPGRGVTIPVITGEPTAAWVAETNKKPVSTATLTTKLMTPYTISVIEPFSNQFKRDAASLYDELVRRLPFALAKVFDSTVIGATTKPGDNFDNFASATKQSILTDTYGGLVAADTDIAVHGGMLNGYALSAQARGILLGAVDSVGRPLFVNNTSEGAIPRLLGAPTHMNTGLYVPGDADDETPAVVGIAGDWTKAMFGTVEGVQIAISDQATLDLGNGTSINLFQQNMFAVRAEVEVGFRADVDAFNLLTGAVPEE